MNAHWITEAARWTADASLAIALPALVVAGLSFVKIVPAKWRALLAVLVLARLLVPAVAPVEWKRAFVISGEKSSKSYVPHETFETYAMPTTTRSNTAQHLVEDRQSWRSIWLGASQNLLPWIWLAGVAGLGFWIAASHRRLARMAKSGSPAGDDLRSLLRECCGSQGIRRMPRLSIISGLESAALFGWLRPVILIPGSLASQHSREELRGIFLHELQHLKRHDSLWNWLGLIACSLHWFNPLAWLVFARYRADRELACDEAALASQPQSARRSYGEALIRSAERFIAPPMLVPSFFASKAELKHRLHHIMKPQPRSIIATACSICIGLGITAFTFTAAKADDEKKKPAAEEGGKDQPREEVKKPALKDGEGGEKKGPKDGEGFKKGVKDGEAKKEGARDGEGGKKIVKDGDGEKKPGPKDGEGFKKGSRDGEMKKEGVRDGEGGEKKGPKDGEGFKKPGAKDGEMKKEGGPRDGEGFKKPGARDGEGGERKGPKEGDGFVKKSAEGEGQKKVSKEGEGKFTKRPMKKESDDAEASGREPLVIRVTADGGSMVVDGKKIAANELRSLLSQIIPQNPGRKVVIEADDTVPFKDVAAALDAARDNGAKGAGIRSAPKDE